MAYLFDPHGNYLNREPQYAATNMFVGSKKPSAIAVATEAYITARDRFADLASSDVPEDQTLAIQREIAVNIAHVETMHAENALRKAMWS